MKRAERKASDWSGDALCRASGVEASEYMFYLMLQATRRREAALAEDLRVIGLSIPKWRALVVIRKLGTCAMSELSHLSSVDRTTLTRTVDQLVRDGLVERLPCRTDRRLTLLRLAEAGDRAAERARQVAQAYNQRMLEGVPEAERAAAVAALQRVVDNMIEEDDEVAYGVLTFGHTSTRNPADP